MTCACSPIWAKPTRKSNIYARKFRNTSGTRDRNTQGPCLIPRPGDCAMENAKLAARNFTQSAIHIIEQLCPRAADRRMSSEATEQTMNMLTLLAILRWERKVGVVALERMGIDLDSLARAVDQSLTATCAD